MGDAFLISFVSVALAAFIGIYIRHKIWGLSNKPKTPNEYGRAWAAYAAFTSVLVSTPRFIHKEFELALIQLLIVILVYPTIAYVVGSLYGLRKFSNQTISKNVVTVQKVFTPPINDIVGLGNLNQDNKSNFNVKQIVTVFSILIGIVILTFGYVLSTKETYICSGEVASTSSETNKSDKVTKSPIEFGFSWNKADKTLELSSIGILKGDLALVKHTS